MKKPGISVDILVVRDGKLLIGLLTKRWAVDGHQVYGVPGRDIRFGEHIEETVKRNIKDEFGCNVVQQEVICVNANYALGNHFIGIGVKAVIDGEAELLLPEDWERWEWFEKDKLPDKMFPATRNLVECYLTGRMNVAG